MFVSINRKLKKELNLRVCAERAQPLPKQGANALCIGVPDGEELPQPLTRPLTKPLPKSVTQIAQISQITFYRGKAQVLSHRYHRNHRNFY